MESKEDLRRAEEARISEITANKRAAQQRATRRSAIKAEKAVARHRQMAEAKEQAAIKSLERKLLRKSQYLTLSGSIFCQCGNARVPWRGGHTAARETIIVENLDVGYGARYTGHIMCTHRKGPNRADEYECQRVHWLDGEGELTLATGDRYRGRWRHNRFMGEGAVTYADGAAFEGMFKHFLSSLPSPSITPLSPDRCSPLLSDPQELIRTASASTDYQDGDVHAPVKVEEEKPDQARLRARRRSVDYSKSRSVEALPPDKDWVERGKGNDGSHLGLELNPHLQLDMINKQRRKSLSLDVEEKRPQTVYEQQMPGRRPSMLSMPLADSSRECCLSPLQPLKSPTTPAPSQMKGGPIELFGEWRAHTGEATEFHVGEGDSYTGAWKDGQRHGVGRCSYRNGDSYTGSWKCGTWHGEGCYSYRDGSKFHGPFDGNVPARNPNFIDKVAAPPVRDGSSFYSKPLAQDALSRPALQSRGALKPIDVKVPLKPIMKAPLPQHGQAFYTFPDGGKFEGLWRKSAPCDGQCDQMRMNEITYSGSLEGGLRHGKGTAKYSSGDVYTGEWDGGMRGGEGLLQQYGGRGGKYEGFWKDDIPWEGEMDAFADVAGNCYTGHVANGEHDGAGVLWYRSGSAFSGTFAGGKAVSGALQHKAEFKGKMGKIC